MRSVIPSSLSKWGCSQASLSRNRWQTPPTCFPSFSSFFLVLPPSPILFIFKIFSPPYFSPGISYWYFYPMCKIVGLLCPGSFSRDEWKPLQHQGCSEGSQDWAPGCSIQRGHPPSSCHSCGCRDFCRGEYDQSFVLKKPAFIFWLVTWEDLKDFFFSFSEKIQLCAFVQTWGSIHCFLLFVHPHWDYSLSNLVLGLGLTCIHTAWVGSFSSDAELWKTTMWRCYFNIESYGERFEMFSVRSF